MKAYVAYNNELSIRQKSSSGGIFYTLAKQILANKGIVFGAAWNADWLVDMIYVDNITDLNKLLKSKYIRANIQNTFEDCKSFLEQGKQVLYSGLPCQITALKQYLAKDYTNLFTLSVACHGLMPLQKWKDYLASAQKPNCTITNIDFRNKTDKATWKGYNFKIEYSDGTKIIQKKNDNSYFSDYLSNKFLNTGCYTCKFKLTENISDIQLGDYWHIEEIHPEMFDNKGTSFVLCYTDAGERLFMDCANKFTWQETDINFLKAKNGGLKTARKNSSIINIQKKHIAIITLPLVGNYGTNLQAYALYKYIENLGYDCTVLNITKHSLKQWAYDNIKLRNFASTEELLAQVKETDYDIFIIGSDQIWRKCHSANDNRGFGNNYIAIPFLEFTKNWNVKRISYGSSIGVSRKHWRYSNEDLVKINNALARFDSISTRELETKNELDEIFNLSTIQVVDPVLLLPKEHYLNLCNNIEKKSIDVFIYLLNKTDDLVQKQLESAISWCKTNNLSFIEANNCSIPEWLAMFRDAKYIVTNSFHGTIFSLLFEKQFITFYNEAKAPYRFNTLDSLFDLNKHIVKFPYYIDSEFFSTKINTLENKIESSKQYLDMALTDDKIAQNNSVNKIPENYILLYTIVKNENNYLREWVEHYKNLGFSHIDLYDNNDIEGENPISVLSDYIDSGFISYTNVRGLTCQQVKCYTKSFNTNRQYYKWISHFDTDEFLDIDKPNIYEFLEQDKFKTFNSISFCWQNFNDSDLITVSNNNYSVNRFNTFTNQLCHTVKRILKTSIGKVQKVTSHGQVFPLTLDIKSCNALGEPTTNTQDIENNTWECGKLRHYRFKTLEEFINFKLYRGYATSLLNYGNDITIQRFFKFNKITHEKISYVYNKLGIDLREDILNYNSYDNNKKIISKNAAFIKNMADTRYQNIVAKPTFKLAPVSQLNNLPCYNLEELSLKSTEEFTINYNNIKFNCLYQMPKYNKTNKLIIMLHGGGTQYRYIGSQKSMFYQRSAYSNLLNIAQLNIVDPTYKKMGKKGPWFYATVINELKAIIEKVKNILNLNNEDIIFWGGSAGGFASIVMSQYFDGCTTVAVNSQLYPVECWVQGVLAELGIDINSSKYADTFNLEKILHSHPLNNYVLIHNAASKADLLRITKFASSLNTSIAYGVTIINNIGIWIYNRMPKIPGRTAHSMHETSLAAICINELINLVKNKVQLTPEIKKMFLVLSDYWGLE